MAERLVLFRQRPQHVANWGAHVGASAKALAEACPKARVVDVESDAWVARRKVLRRKSAWWSPQRWSASRSTLGEDEIADGSVELLWSNMALHGCADIEAQLARWRQCIANDGFLMFSTLGPGTLAGLRDLYRRCDWPTPMAPLVDMHDLGDILVQSGFSDPVMDQEQLTLTWSCARDMLAELRTLGANVDPERFQGLRTPRWRDELERAADDLRGADGRVHMNFELVYGHAFCPTPKPRVREEVQFSLEHMRSMLRSGRAKP